MRDPILRLVTGQDRIPTTNLVTNPSFELGTTGWTNAVYATFEQSSAEAKFGDNSLHVIADTQNDTAAYTLSSLTTAGTYTFSAWVKAFGTTAQLRAISSPSNDEIGTANYTGTGEWERLTVTGSLSAGESAAIIHLRDTAASGWTHIYFDGIQVEERSSATEYCDGDQPECLWNGTAHASTSTRTTASVRTKINLLELPGFALKSVTPMAPAYRDGGTYRESVFADGRRLVDTKYNNVIETYTLAGFDYNQDSFSQRLRDLRGILRKAAQYWTDEWREEPVWLEAKAALETNTRYALVMNGSLIEENSHWNQPFLQPGCAAVMDDLDMVIERGPWLSQEPTLSEGVELSGVELAPATTNAGQPPNNLISEANDDAEYHSGLPAYARNSTEILMGDTSGSDRDGIFRFQDVRIPQGATIAAAKITFTAATTLSSTTVNLTIYGEKSANAAQIAGGAGAVAAYLGRPRTDNSVAWNNLATWTAETTVDTPDLTSIVQEIVNLPDFDWGSSMQFFFENNASTASANREAYAYDSDPTKVAVLEVKWTADIPVGNVDWARDRDPTSGRGVFVANKWNVANITHIYHYDSGAATYSENLLFSTGEFNLLPSSPATGDKIYIGIEANLTDAGPFSSVIFDIGTPAVYTGAATINWTYWNGAETSFTAITDRTGYSKPFEKTGVGGIFFLTPGGWISTAVNSTIAYWVIGTVSLGGGTVATIPTQQNRPIYSITWPYVEVQSSEVSGDLDAILKVAISAASSSSAAGALSKGAAGRIIAGARSVNRGERFVAALNFSQNQNPDGVTVSTTTLATFTSDIDASPTGEHIACTSNGTHQERFKIVLDNTIASDFLGRFRAFIRINMDTAAGPGTGKINLEYKVGSGGAVVSGDIGTFAFYGSGPLPGVLVDLGVINFASPNMKADQIEIAVHASALVAWDAVDLWFIPIDEWATDIVDRTDTSGAYVIDDRRALLDNVTNPKREIYGMFEGDDMKAEYQAVTSGPPVLPPNQRVRLYFLTTSLSDALGNVTSTWEAVNAVTIESLERYMGLRGSA